MSLKRKREGSAEPNAKSLGLLHNWLADCQSLIELRSDSRLYNLIKKLN